MIITIGGPPGSGKTTVAEKLAADCDIVLISSGKHFRKMAENKNMSLREFGLRAEKDENIDKELDNRIVQEIKRQHETRDVVVDGRLAAFMVELNELKAFKVWIDAPLDVRAKRIAQRERVAESYAREDIMAREASEKSRYKSIYDIDLTELKIYDLVIDSRDLLPDAIVKIIRDEAGI